LKLLIFCGFSKHYKEVIVPHFSPKMISNNYYT